jgi:hypothetical protein
MNIDRNRIAKLIQNAKRIEIMTLNPHESDQQRRETARKMLDQAVSASNRRSISLIIVDI